MFILSLGVIQTGLGIYLLQVNHKSSKQQELITATQNFSSLIRQNTRMLIQALHTTYESIDLKRAHEVDNKNLIIKVAKKIQQRSEFPIFEIYSNKGQQLLNIGEPLSKKQLKSQKITLLNSALREELNTTFLNRSGKLALLGSVKIKPKGKPNRVIVIGTYFDQDFVDNFRNHHNVHISIIINESLVTSTLSASKKDQKLQWWLDQGINNPEIYLFKDSDQKSNTRSETNNSYFHVISLEDINGIHIGDIILEAIITPWYINARSWILLSLSIISVLVFIGVFILQTQWREFIKQMKDMNKNIVKIFSKMNLTVSKKEIANKSFILLIREANKLLAGWSNQNKLADLRNPPHIEDGKISINKNDHYFLLTLLARFNNVIQNPDIKPVQTKLLQLHAQSACNRFGLKEADLDSQSVFDWISDAIIIFKKHQPYLEKSGVELNIQKSQTRMVLRTDRAAIRQAMTHLIDSASNIFTDVKQIRCVFQPSPEHIKHHYCLAFSFYKNGSDRTENHLKIEPNIDQLQKLQILLGPLVSRFNGILERTVKGTILLHVPHPKPIPDSSNLSIILNLKAKVNVHQVIDSHLNRSFAGWPHDIYSGFNGIPITTDLPIILITDELTDEINELPSDTRIVLFAEPNKRIIKDFPHHIWFFSGPVNSFAITQSLDIVLKSLVSPIKSAS